MAVTSKRKGVSPKVIKEMGEAFVDQAQKLWKEHIKEALEVMEDSEEPIITINFNAVLNFSESAPKLTTKIRFTKSYTDEKVDEFEDPNQMPLGDIPEASKKKE